MNTKRHPQAQGPCLSHIFTTELQLYLLFLHYLLYVTCLSHKDPGNNLDSVKHKKKLNTLCIRIPVCNESVTGTHHAPTSTKILWATLPKLVCAIGAKD